MQINAIELQQQDINVIPSAKAFAGVFNNLIAQAKNRIVISALYLENDQAGQAVLMQLVAAKQKNPTLSISVIVDDHRARRGRIGDKTAAGNVVSYQALCRKYDVDIAFYGIRVKTREIMGVMHLKGMFFDDMVLYSGASINNVYLHQHSQYRLDRYYQIKSKALADSMCDLLLTKLIGKGLASSLLDSTVVDKSQLKQLSQRTFSMLRHAQYQLPKQSKEAELSVTPILGCGKKHNALNDLSLSLLNESSRSVVLITPYFNLPKKMIKAITLAMQRGVSIKIIVGDKVANDFFIADENAFSTIGIIPYLYEKLLRRFVKKYQEDISQGKLNIHVWQDGDHSFHAKGMIVDDKYHLLTGSNMNPRAWNLDLENAILLQDHQKVMMKTISQELDNILKNTRKITDASMLDEERQYPEKPRKMMKKLTFSRIDRILKRFL
ncbi:CDP-diacylglycerol--serine O-phosphatidyltransferase [Thalassotalea sp. 1_MG-2023]|uniref:CDP-diacylglycerol--serine O-phosphatidyltransferase n=1 Tax=Thalassotalea sp. 1_MG-2023 TaxID=3062680 RepID=UPI0026E22127|nr:CDP-diacylglycerol--serine O-phosphatidyltransferase [Thalassotalea sp. 1_MG-2023]MDO6428149.1 CDP-diacylglycerol--serine O-phosphatidyltransferase [Thalassotalea sp. 1_MG-2023]